MTVVGKILVFLNLLFALVVGAFAAMDYTARTHWADGYKKLEQSHKVLADTNRTYKSEADRLTKQIETSDRVFRDSGVVGGPIQDPSKVTESVVAALRKQNAENTLLRNKLNDANKNLEEANRKVLAYETGMKTGQENVKRIQEDLVKTRAVLKDETQRNIDLTKGINEMRDRAVAAEIQSRSFKDINTKLEDEMQKLARDLARIKATGGRPSALASGLNPPPEEVEGLVSRVDGNYVKLTIGADAGLAKGHTMYVFGVNGSGSGYRGQIRLESVSAKEAVGVLVGKSSMPMKVGDTVATSILGGKK